MRMRAAEWRAKLITQGLNNDDQFMLIADLSLFELRHWRAIALLDMLYKDADNEHTREIVKTFLDNSPEVGK